MPGHLRPYLNTRNSARASNSLWTSHEPCASGIIREAKSDQQTRIKKSQRLSQGFTSPRNLSVARYLNSGAREAGMSLGHILASHDVQHRRAVIIATRRARPSRLQAIRRYLAGDAKRLVARFEHLHHTNILSTRECYLDASLSAHSWTTFHFHLDTSSARPSSLRRWSLVRSSLR